MNRTSRIATLLTLFVLALLLFVPAASAFDGRSGERVVIAKDEVINDDLFVGGNTVVVDGTVNGDLIVGGQTVTINGKVTGNVITAGSSVTVNGEVGQDLLAAGAAVTIGRDARIGHNAYTAGASVESQAGSRIDGSLIIAAGQGLVSGQITNDLLAGAGRLRLENTVGRNAQLAVGATTDNWSPSYSWGSNMPPMPAVQPGLTFGPEAHVAGSLEYTSPEAALGAESVSAQVKHTLPPQDQQLSQELARRESTSSRVFDAVRRLVALLLVGLLIAWLAPRWITGPAEKLVARPLPSLGLGLVGLIAAPLTWLVALGVIILVAVIWGLLSLGSLSALTLLAGFPALGLAFVAILIALGHLCQTIIAYLAGRWIIGRIQPAWNGKLYAPVLAGLLLLGVLFAVPVAGGVLELLVILAGLGAIILALTQGRPGAAPAAQAAEASAAVQA